MTPQEIDEISRIAEKYDIYLLSDEIYSRMIFDQKNKFYSPGRHDACKERTIIINGFSKAFAMTGWRIGVAIGPKKVIEKMGLLLQTIVSCVPPFIQLGAIEAIKGAQGPINKMLRDYQSRRDVLIEGLSNIPGLKCIKPEGAIYAFPNIRGTGMSSDEFVRFSLNKAGLAFLPGTNFGVNGEGFVRICFANSIENINQAIFQLNDQLAKVIK